MLVELAEDRWVAKRGRCAVGDLRDRRRPRAEYVADNQAITDPAGDAAERLLEHAERRVDARLGPDVPDRIP